MPPLRPSLYPRYLGYVCPSCIAKLQASRRPPWQIRNAATQSKPDGREGKIRQKKTQADIKLADDDVIVKHYDQGLDGTLEPAEDDLPDDTLEDLKSRIAALEADLQKFKAGRSIPEGKSLIDQMLNSKPPSTSDASFHQPGNGKPAAPVTPQASLQHPRIPVELFQDRRKNIARLNQALQKFAEQPSSATYTKDLWKWYSHCRANLASAWHLVPSNVWTLLWEAFSRTGGDNPNRMTHVRRLSEDIKAAGAQLDSPQTLLYLESLFIEGNIKEAVSQWESAQTTLAYDESTASKYWELGVRMLSSDGQPERAQQATDLLINGLGGKSDPRVLISIIRSWLETSDPVAVQRSWAIYVRLRLLLGPGMQMKDYDAVAGAFLAVHQTGLALAVFKDMMLTEDPSASDHDSVTLYKRSLRTVGDFKSFQLSPVETSWKSQEAFTALPRNKQNKYFYGSWIKKLIGDGEIDWAAQVATLMYQRGIVPDPRHMNGIIGAWLRSGTAQSQQKAEDLGWKMIGNRIDFVKSRDQPALEAPLRAVITFAKKSFDRPSQFTQVPTPATIETFCILINYYRIRRRGDRVQELCTAIEAAKIRPNTSFLNDLLLVGAMQDRKQWAWNTYSWLVNSENVEPDFDTFTVLWQMLKDHLQKKAKLDFPSPRSLFAEMAKWRPSTERGTLSRETYELILDCFMTADDQIGTLVALRAMQRLYDTYPDEDTVRNIVLGLARTGYRKILPQHLRRQDRTKDMQHRTTQITEALKRFKDQRTKDLMEKGVTPESMDAASRAQGVILLLGDLLRYASRSSIVHPGGSGYNLAADEYESDMQQLVQVAGEEMGVPQCA